MKRPPRDPKAPLIDRCLVWRIIYVSVLMALGTFGLFFYEIAAGSSLETARAVAVNAIVFFEVAYLFNSRHLSDSMLQSTRILRKSRRLVGHRRRRGDFNWSLRTGP